MSVYLYVYTSVYMCVFTYVVMDRCGDGHTASSCSIGTEHAGYPAGSSAAIAPPTGDHDGAVLQRPDHLAAYQWMAGKRAEAVPRWRSQGRRRLVTVRPQPDLELPVALAVHSPQPDHVDLSTAASPPAERNSGHRNSTALQLVPHRRTRHQLPSRRAQPRCVDLRGRSASRG